MVLPIEGGQTLERRTKKISRKTTVRQRPNQVGRKHPPQAALEG
jgi:hypothetical protein